MAGSDIHVASGGAYVSLPELIALRFPARQLGLTRQRRALSILAGPNKTNFRGRGIDFEEVRSYQSGDDIRTIDWRVTARTGEAHTRLFREERERPVLVVVDQRAGMFFGSVNCCKSVLAAQLASLLAWSALHGGDRVGGFVFGDREHGEIRPRRSRRTVLALLSEILAYNRRLPAESAGPERFADTLVSLRRIARPGSSLYLVSDFHGAGSERAREQLFELAKHTEITALCCHDPLETTLPRAGRLAVTDGRDRALLDTGDAGVRERFGERFEARQAALARDARRLGIPLLQVSTADSPLAVLQTYYADVRR